MYYLVIVDHNGMAAHFTRSDCEGFQEVLYIQCHGCDLRSRQISLFPGNRMSNIN